MTHDVPPKGAIGMPLADPRQKSGRPWGKGMPARPKSFASPKE